MQWKTIPCFGAYEVSEHGNVRRGLKDLKPERVQGSGRKRFKLSKGGRQYTFKAAQLVALAFIGPPPFEGAEVCHNDGFHHNSHFSNLRYDNHAGNAADVAKHNLQKRDRTGLRVPMSKRLSVEASEFLRKA